jgi:hypothetical protein
MYCTLSLSLSLSELFPVLSDEDSKMLLPFLFVCVEFILHFTGNRARDTHRQRHAEAETDIFLQRRSSLPCRKTLFNKQFAICVL